MNFLLRIISLNLLITVKIIFSNPYHPTTNTNKNCQIPFVYKGKIYHDCTNVDDTRFWCYMDKGFSKWEYCQPLPERFKKCNKAQPNITLEEVEEILYEHNSFRASLPALRMRKLEWNSELAQKAQAAANRCAHLHVESTLCGDKNSTGQNLFYSYYQYEYPAFMTWKKVIEAWKSERKFFNMSTATCSSGELCGHFTQVAWYNTGLIGCGKSKCYGDLQKMKQYSIQYYCNYYEGHISSGYVPYEISTEKKCQDCYHFDENLKFTCNKDQLCEVCNNDSENCVGLDTIKKMSAEGKICTDIHNNCHMNKELCNEMNKGTDLPRSILEYLQGCSKTCKKCV